MMFHKVSGKILPEIIKKKTQPDVSFGKVDVIFQKLNTSSNKRFLHCFGLTYPSNSLLCVV